MFAGEDDVTCSADPPAVIMGFEQVGALFDKTLLRLFLLCFEVFLAACAGYYRNMHVK